MNTCPHNLKFGVDTDKHTICENCPDDVYNLCIDASDQRHTQKTEKKPTYSELLQHPKWQRKRLKIFSRDNWTCRTCGDTETTLHCHHKKYTYGNTPWEYPDEDLITLCKTCHDIVGMLKKDENHLDIETMSISYTSEYTIVADKTPKAVLIINDEIWTIGGTKDIQHLIMLLSKCISHE